MGDRVIVRDAVAADFPAVLELNAAAVPHVNLIGTEELAWLARHASFFRVAEDAEGLAGFAIVLPSGTDYWSDNYTWFSARFDRFLYLDRVVVHARARRAGVGRALYEALFAFARDGGWPRVTLEVNLRPPNPDSERFHERMGFATIGTREYHEGANAVLMMARETA